MAADGLVVFLPEHAQGEVAWARVIGGELTQKGSGARWLHATGVPQLPAQCRVMLVAPVGLVTLHWTDLPNMPVRQGRAAARLMAMDVSIGPADSLHIAVSDGDDDARRHAVAVVARSDMAQWLLWAQEHGLDPDAVVPGALLLPEPESGFVLGRVGEADVLRGAQSALRADDPFAAHVVGEEPVADVDPAMVERAMIAALDVPVLNLRQGAFAKRRARGFDWGLARRAAMLIGGIALGSLLITLLLIAKYNAAAGALEEDSILLAQTVLPSGQEVSDPLTQLDARLATLGGERAALTGPVASLMQAMQPHAAVSVTQLSRTADGVLTATLAAPRPEDVNGVLIALQEAGFTITATPQPGAAGQSLVNVTVKP